jgi:hypothetical protein
LAGILKKFFSSFLTRFLSGLLYGVKPGDPLTLAAVSALGLWTFPDFPDFPGFLLTHLAQLCPFCDAEDGELPTGSYPPASGRQ